jgi:hypothetical protein
MAKVGAKTKYRKDYARQAFVACSEGGFTNPKLAKLFGVTVNTIKNWKRDFPKFLAAVRDGKDIWDTRMAEDCILKRIKGYRYNEETKEVGENGELKTTRVVRKEVAGDVKAQIFWLRNRNRERWPDIRLSEGSLKVESKKDMPDLPDDITVKEAEEIYRDILGS